MPKKIGTNPKALEARERKATQKKTAQDQATRAAEDALWADDDKHAAKKKNRKEDEERKRVEQQRKKAENKALLEQESAAFKPVAKQSIQKVTQAQIRDETERRNKVIESINKPAGDAASNSKLVNDQPLVENLNRFDGEVIEASGIDDAIKALSVSAGGADKHPEKRLKAAYKAYEEANMSRLKLENPSMRLSQLKQILFKEWTKSPENPLNQQI